MDPADRIEVLKREKDALVLAHNYQPGAIQDLADIVGDSLELAMRASSTDCRVILVCGVLFMAETAKILNPDRTVLIPEVEALCPMASMCSPEAIRAAREEHPDAEVVGYVNSTAACKAEMDVCCTSANAVKVVRSLESDEVIFVPDRNLGMYVARNVPEKRVLLWDGYCPTHNSITLGDVVSIREEHPDAEVMVHPECRPEVIDASDLVGSTGDMVRYVRSKDVVGLVVGTEVDMVHRLEKESPGTTFHALHNAICPPMKMFTPESVANCLETGVHEVLLDERTIERARRPLERMLSIGR